MYAWQSHRLKAQSLAFISNEMSLIACIEHWAPKVKRPSVEKYIVCIESLSDFWNFKPFNLMMTEKEERGVCYSQCYPIANDMWAADGVYKLVCLAHSTQLTLKIIWKFATSILRKENKWNNLIPLKSKQMFFTFHMNIEHFIITRVPDEDYLVVQVILSIFSSFFTFSF